MRLFLIICWLSLAVSIPDGAEARAALGDRGPRKPKVPEPEIEKEEPATPLDEQWKWMLAALVVVFVGFTVWRLLSESAKVRPPEKRQPWEIE